jgi:S-DNA-T family DNA segregation ATPase FtsK/SpoIIIE
MAAKKRSKKTGTEAALSPEVRQDIIGLFLIFFAIFILIANLYPTTTGLLGRLLLNNVLMPMMGKGVVLLPLVAAVSGMFMLFRKKYLEANRRIFGFTLSFFMFITISELLTSGPVNEFSFSQINQNGGGAMGYMIAYSLQKTLGPAGTYFIVLTLALVAGLLTFNLSLGHIRQFVFKVFGLLFKELLLPPKKNKKMAKFENEYSIPDQELYSKKSVASVMQSMKEMFSGPAQPQTLKRPLPKKNISQRMMKSLEAVDEIEDLEEEKNVAPAVRSLTFREKMQAAGLAAPISSIPQTPVSTIPAYETTTSYADYELPPVDLLAAPKKNTAYLQKLEEQSQEDIQILENTLASFKIEAKVVNYSHGPSITRYELQPAPGVRVSRIASLADDIALSLAAHGVRIEAPIPGKSVVGIEVPNSQTQPVFLREMLERPEFLNHPSNLTFALGFDISGLPIYCDLATMPHLLIAGATGSGKSVCINTLITSLMFKNTPEQLKFLMIDPKRVELTPYNDIPHLLAPVVNDATLAASALKTWAVKEMERRYELFSKVGARHLARYNEIASNYIGQNKKFWSETSVGKNMPAEIAEKMPIKKEPHIVVVIDELADLMMVASADVESAICRLAQMARAVGIHLVLATQRPSVDVITGLIKANVPSRVAFAVSSQIDSRTILDMAGAEKLLGRGDMLYSPIGARKPIRLQGVYVQDKEISAVIKHVKSQGKAEYVVDLEKIKQETQVAELAEINGDGKDEFFEQAKEIVATTGKTSISYLQRRLRIGYNRAARLQEELIEAGVINPNQTVSL